jgi:hypothetical protein
MRHVAGWTALLAAGIAAAFAVASSGASKLHVHLGCPAHFSAAAVQESLIDGAIAAARSVVIDHRTETNQGRVTRRTPQNYWLSEVTFVPPRESLHGQAVGRCGAEVASFSWALVFHDGESPVASDEDVRFALRMRDGWWIY